MKIKYLVPVMVIATILFSANAIGVFDFFTPVVCGNDVCESGETAGSCPEDCGGYCGDGICHNTENEFSCPQDCAYAPVCGDNLCESGEDVYNCPGDCKGTCGDEICHETENVNTCPDDCYGYCGDEYCHPTEETTCNIDCLSGCGNGICEQSTCQSLGCPLDETIYNCPEDCTPEEPPPTGGLETVCSNEELKSFITNYGGSDDYLVDELESACSSFGTDLDGCPVYLDYSNFDVTVQPDGKQLAWSECVSVCEWDEKGRPMNGHILFSVIWYVGPPRTFEGLPEPTAGIFTTQDSCEPPLSLLSLFFGNNYLPTKTFR